MDYYEKKYKEALVRLQEALAPCEDGCKISGLTRDRLENIFPELEKYNDEKIRGAIIHFISHTPTVPLGRIDKKTMLAWLEKQGEQNPAYKVEPKFHPGDWIIDNIGHIYQIETATEIESEHIFGYTIVGGGYCNDNSDVRLWTIQDAKDGDLIYVSTEVKGIQAIFHKFENGIIYFHCNLCSDFIQGGYEPFGDVECVYPLQKTHYQKFFQKMEEAGYKWDTENKCLTKK